jgi:NAD(P)H-hydrate repair Nnr-like enzyme with NAD(P)H-hydrate dehydratase domain
VLKGSGTIVATPGQIPKINASGNGLLATGGTGDVLAGFIGAKLANGHPAFIAACEAVYRHGAVADQWKQIPLALQSAALTASALSQSL